MDAVTPHVGEIQIGVLADEHQVLRQDGEWPVITCLHTSANAPATAANYACVYATDGHASKAVIIASSVGRTLVFLNGPTR